MTDSARPAAYAPATAARQLGLTQSQLEQLIRRGELVAIKIGHRRIIPAAEIDRIVAAGIDLIVGEAP